MDNVQQQMACAIQAWGPYWKGFFHVLILLGRSSLRLFLKGILIEECRKLCRIFETRIGECQLRLEVCTHFSWDAQAMAHF